MFHNNNKSNDNPNEILRKQIESMQNSPWHKDVTQYQQGTKTCKFFYYNRDPDGNPSARIEVKGNHEKCFPSFLG